MTLPTEDEVRGLVERLDGEYPSLAAAELHGSAIIIARAYLALSERVGVLEKAATDLRDDLIMRGEKEEDGTIVVNASAGRWVRFCAALSQDKSVVEGPKQ